MNARQQRSASCGLLNRSPGLNVCPAWFAWVINNPLRRWLHDPAEVLHGLVSPGSVVLEIGCGSGPFTIALAELVGPSGRVIAADLQPAMLAKVRKRVERAGLEDRVELHVCERDRIGLSTPVDFALAFWMLHEVPNALTFLKEIHGLLNDDGKLLLVEPKLHVGSSEFRVEMEAGWKAEFTLLAQPSIRLSRSALFAK